MLEKKIKYTDYNGNQREETFYFNISKAEMMRMQMGHTGGYDEYLKRIVNGKDSVSIYKAFEDIIKLSYGVKTEDGRSFVKTKEATDLFLQSEAYSELIMEFFTNTQSAIDFVKNVMPKEAVEAAEKDKAFEDIVKQNAA